VEALVQQAKDQAAAENIADLKTYESFVVHPVGGMKVSIKVERNSETGAVKVTDIQLQYALRRKSAEPLKEFQSALEGLKDLKLEETPVTLKEVESWKDFSEDMGQQGRWNVAAAMYPHIPRWTRFLHPLNIFWRYPKMGIVEGFKAGLNLILPKAKVEAKDPTPNKKPAEEPSKPKGDKATGEVKGGKKEKAKKVKKAPPPASEDSVALDPGELVNIQGNYLEVAGKKVSKVVDAAPPHPDAKPTEISIEFQVKELVTEYKGEHTISVYLSYPPNGRMARLSPEGLKALEIEAVVAKDPLVKKAYQALLAFRNLGFLVPKPE